MSSIAIRVGDRNIVLDNSMPLVCIAGPCAIESQDHALEMAGALVELTSKIGMELIYKSSFDKANRSSSGSYRGVGMAKGLEILAQTREKYGIPVLTDIHEPYQAEVAARFIDFLQIPAFLCRQTDLVVAAAKTGKPVNIKKGQFVAPEDMKNIAQKALASGDGGITLCERGTFFGYHNLVVDMRSLPIMAATGLPVIFDATHSAQLPGAMGAASGGQREFVFPLARAAVAVGVAGIFMEVHHDPDKAPCDGPNMLSLKALPKILDELKKIDNLVKGATCEPLA